MRVFRSTWHMTPDCLDPRIPQNQRVILDILRDGDNVIMHHPREPQSLKFPEFTCESFERPCVKPPSLFDKKVAGVRAHIAELRAKYPEECGLDAVEQTLEAYVTEVRRQEREGLLEVL